MHTRRDFFKWTTLMALLSTLTLKATPIEYLKNNKLTLVKDDFIGNVFKDNSFQNLYGKSGMTTFVDLLKWKMGKNPKQYIKDTETYALEVIEDATVLERSEDYICWLGHASFLIQINGKKLITDPCLTAPPFIDRLTKVPLTISNIKPDYLLISHGHFDHLDSDTIKHFHNSTALVPLQMAKLIIDMNPSVHIQEAGWYQKYNISENFEVYLLPAHHWHRRSLSDRDEVLWGSYLIKTPTKTIYFAGDTGYSKHFKDIHKLFGEIDIAILPIGAYDPSWFMKSSHISPSEALTAYKDLHAKEFIPMHFGTFDLTNEPLGEPEQILRKIGKNENINFLTIGKAYLI